MLQGKMSMSGSIRHRLQWHISTKENPWVSIGAMLRQRRRLWRGVDSMLGRRFNILPYFCSAGTPLKVDFSDQPRGLPQNETRWPSSGTLLGRHRKRWHSVGLCNLSVPLWQVTGALSWHARTGYPHPHTTTYNIQPKKHCLYNLHHNYGVSSSHKPDTI